MTDPIGTTRNSYDILNRLTATTDPNGFQLQYQYDTTGNVSTLTYPSNKTVSYAYDALNRLKTVTIDWLNNTPTTTYHYDAAGRVTQTDQANGSQTQYSYDNADSLTRLTHTANSQILASYQYTLDPNGNRTKALVEAPQLPEQLINHNQSYSYNAQGNRLNNTNNATLTYDNEGQLTSKTDSSTATTTNYSFDYAHRLIQQGNNQYSYDGIGNRIKAIRNGQITKYIYDAAGNLLAEADNTNQIKRYYIYDHGLIGFIDAATNQLYTYHFDGTGHTVAITDPSQNTINTYAYDPYGKLMAESETVPQPFKYVGQLGVFAEDNGLYYMRARYYDAEVGRFISEDPIGFQGGLNLYAYVGGNPLLLVDPSGLTATEFGGNVSIPAWARNPIGFALFATTYSSTLGDSTLTDKQRNSLFKPYLNSQDKKLTNGEVDKLIKGGVHPHDLKDNSKQDLFKDRNGNIVVKPKSGIGPGDPTGHNINDF